MDAGILPIRGVCLLLMMLIGVAVLRVSSAPVSAKNAVGKNETVTKNNELKLKEKAVSANTESASSSASKSLSSSSSGPAVPVKRSLPNSAPVNPHPVPASSVPVNPVPGQIQSQLREGWKAAASEDNRRTSDEDNEFLENEEDVEEDEDKAPAAATAPEKSGGDENQQWQYLLADRRIQDLMANSDQERERQRFDSYPSASSESLNSRALTDYLVRTGEIDRTLDDLVDAGVMTSEEARLYREAIDLEYGSNPQSTSNDKVVADPEVIYDDGEPSDALYDGPNYLQPLPVDYQLPAADYLNLASQPLQQQDEEEEEEREEESMVPSDDDYGQSTGSRFKDEDEEKAQEETNELLRDLLGTIALQQEDGEGLSYKSLPAENEVQKPNLLSATSQWSSSAERQYGDDRGTAIEKELEALPTTGGEGVKTDGLLEEEQLEEMRNRVRPEKTKQDNRTKPIKNSH